MMNLYVESAMSTALNLSGHLLKGGWRNSTDYQTNTPHRMPIQIQLQKTEYL